MSVTVANVQTFGAASLGFVIDSNISGSFSVDDRITITNGGTTFQNIDNAGVATTLNNASGGTSDFQIRTLTNPFQGQAGKTGITLELQGTTTEITVSGGAPVDGPVASLTFAAYSGGGGGGGGGSGNGKITIKGTGKQTVKGNGKVTVK